MAMYTVFLAHVILGGAMRHVQDETRLVACPESCAQLPVCQVQKVEELADGCPIPSCGPKVNETCPRECVPVKFSLESKELSPADLGAAVKNCHVTSVYLIWLKNQASFESYISRFFDALVDSKVTELELAYFGCQAVTGLAKVLEKTPLKGLTLRGTKCKATWSDEWTPLYTALSKSQVESFDLGYTEMKSGGLELLAPALPQAKQLKSLSLDSCYIGDKGLQLLATSLPSSEISTLDLRYNELTANGVKHLAENLKDSKLTNLNLQDNTEIGDGMVALVEALPGTPVKDLKMNRVYDAYGKKVTDLRNLLEPLAKALPQSNVTSLDVSDNEVCEYFGECKMAENFIKALPKSNLTNLKLSRTRVHNLPKDWLPDLLSIPHLNLEENGFEDDFAVALAEVLPNTSVKSLSFSNTLFSITKVKKLAYSLYQSRNLTSFKLASGMKIARDDKDAEDHAGRMMDKIFARILPYSPHLKALDLANNHMSASELIGILPQTNLTSLSLRNNEAVKWQVDSLCQQIPKTQLRTLDLQSCGISRSRDVTHLYRAILNSSLKDVNIQFNNLHYYDQYVLLSGPVFNKLGEPLDLKYTT